MKKILKNNLKLVIAFIAGATIFSSITYAATLNFASGDVEHTKADGTKINVKDALNELYYKANNQASYAIIDSSKIVEKTYSGSLAPHNYEDFQSYYKTIYADDGYFFLGASTTGYMSVTFNSDYSEAYLTIPQSDVSFRSGTCTLKSYPGQYK